MSDYFEKYQDDFDVHCYSDEEIIDKILKVSNDRVEHLHDSLQEIKDIKVYKFKIINVKRPQTALKVYKVISNYDETCSVLSGILEVSIDEINSGLEFYFYEVNEGTMRTYVKFINGEWGLNDDIPTPVQQGEFDTKDIDNLIDDIYGVYC
ncbi:hypothetical protein [Clostridium algidicarnis]|uniref:hypothetical protein n=1 Tax=Clostridium algidicarnis TaxID=37659 RepID=UPI001C0D3616|nr:hypothetical protein [Clostridium algidicarnis]MBU3209051.1 hypothetical protein [Clostridium algidicarnis]MBU3228773.1 hypothetical protein [Clostridium algidicarnis]MBU3252317.1 hypothetical protein [Clostridium algidicarnis]